MGCAEGSYPAIYRLHLEEGQGFSIEVCLFLRKGHCGNKGSARTAEGVEERGCAADAPGGHAGGDAGECKGNAGALHPGGLEVLRPAAFGAFRKPGRGVRMNDER